MIIRQIREGCVTSKQPSLICNEHNGNGSLKIVIRQYSLVRNYL